MSPTIARAIATGLTLYLGTTPSRGDAGRSCDARTDILVIYECESGLVLWSRRTETEQPPVIASDKELCHFVRPSEPNRSDRDACL